MHTWVVIHTYRVRRRLGLPSGREKLGRYNASKQKKKRRVSKTRGDVGRWRDERKKALDGGRRKSLVLGMREKESACGGHVCLDIGFSVYAPCCLMWISFVSFVCVAIAWI